MREHENIYLEGARRGKLCFLVAAFRIGELSVVFLTKNISTHEGISFSKLHIR